jgi:hypothetical protein
MTACRKGNGLSACTLTWNAQIFSHLMGRLFPQPYEKRFPSTDLTLYWLMLIPQSWSSKERLKCQQGITWGNVLQDLSLQLK